MIWAGIIDHLVEYITPLEGIALSLVVESRGSLEWFSIPRPVGSVMLRKREENNQNNMSAQITLREAKKYGYFCNS